jgi:hypothetical protein
MRWEILIPHRTLDGQLPNKCAMGILIPYHIGMCFVNSPSNVDGYVDVIGGNTWFLTRVNQHAMGNFNSSSRSVWPATPTMCDGFV